MKVDLSFQSKANKHLNATVSQMECHTFPRVARARTIVTLRWLATLLELYGVMRVCLLYTLPQNPRGEEQKCQSLFSERQCLPYTPFQNAKSFLTCYRFDWFFIGNLSSGWTFMLNCTKKKKEKKKSLLFSIASRDLEFIFWNRFLYGVIVKLQIELK